MPSKRIAGITIDINGDATKLNKSLKSVDSQLRVTQTSLRDVNKLLKFDPGNADLLAQKQKGLQSAISSTKDRLEQLQNVSRKGLSDEEWDALQREIIETEQNLKKLESEYQSFGSVAKQQIIAAGQSMQETGDKLKNIGSSMQNVGKTLTTSLTLPITAIGVAAVKTTADFDAGMSKVAAISGATGAELEALRDKAKEMGETTKFSASESAEALEYMAMAGWKTDDMLNGLSGVMDLAAASGEDLGTTSDIVTDAITAFGLSAEDSGHFADVLAAASSNANTNVSMMGSTFKYAAPLAGALGYSVEDTALAIGLMANSGIKATQAGTSLRGLFTRLAKPTKQSREAMEELNISLTNADGSMRPLGELLVDMRGKFEGLTETEKASYAAMLAGQNGMSGFLAIMNATTSDVDKLTTAIKGSSGAAHDMAETMQDNLAGQLTILKSQLEGVAIQVGEELMPYAKKMVSQIQKLAEKFSKLNKKQKDTIIKVAGIVAAVGPLLVIGGKLTSGIGNMVSGIGSLLTKFPGLIAGLTGQTVALEGATVAQLALNAATLAFPIVALATAVGAGIYALTRLGQSASEANKEIAEVEEIQSGVSDTANTVAESANHFAEAIKNAGSESRATALQAENAANKLLEISSSGDTSKESLAKMSVAIKQLNSLYPGWGLELDRSTGKLNKSGDEIKAFVQKTKEMSKIDRLSEMVSISMNEIATATKNVSQAQYDLDKAYAKKDGIKSRVDLMESLGEKYRNGQITLLEFQQRVHAADESLKLIDADTIEWNGQQYNAHDLTQTWANELTELDQTITDAEDSLSAANIELEAAEKCAETAQGALDSYKESQEQAKDAIEGTGEALRYSISDAEEADMAWQQLDADTQQLAIDVTAAMEAIQTAVSNSVSSQMDMFSAWEEKSTVSTATLLQNMQDQVAGVTEWEENLVKLSEMGIDQGLLQHLAEMGPEGRNYVAAFADMSSEEMAKANELWRQKLDIEGFTNEAGQKLTEGIGTMAAGSEEAFTQLGEQLGVEAEQTGGYIGQGLIDGMANVSEEVTSAGTELGEDLIDAIDEAAGVASPSTKTTETGKYIDEGLANGIKNGIPVVTAASTALTNAVDINLIQKLNAFKPKAQAIGLATATSLATGLRSGVPNVSGAAQALVSTIQNSCSQIQSQQGAWQNTGMMLSIGLANGIMAGQSAVVNAAAAVAAAAIATAMSALQIGSPSKLADKLIGRNFDAGIAQGIEKGTPGVLDSVSRLTSAMVSVPGRSAALEAGAGSVTNLDYGGTVINVYGAEGQDVERLAEVVEQRLNSSYVRRQAAFGRV